MLWLNLNKQKKTGKTADGGTTDVEIMMPLKCLRNFWKTSEMYLTNCEVNLILTWLEKCLLSIDTKATTFAITDTKLYVLVVPLLTRDITKLLQQLKSGLKITINWKNVNQM